LRQIVARRWGEASFLIGATTGSWALSGPAGEVLGREFNYVTPENDFKQWEVHPRPGVWSWAKADAWLPFVSASDLVVRIHGPVSPQCSDWAKDDRRTAEELAVNMTEFMTELCRRYDDAEGFRYLDVVNETVVQGRWHANKPGTPWECPWIIIGRDDDPNRTPAYIRMAFEIATVNAPGLKLIVNQHEPPEAVASWDLLRETVGYLRGLGLRIDGIGWQAHVDAGWQTASRIERLHRLIEWAHDNGLGFHVTEASSWLRGPVGPGSLERQAATYAAILETLLAHREEGEVTWNTWHISDSMGWHTEWKPALLDERFQPKPAYYAIQRILLDG
jgi:GH35 family endo-1,4-beta-xylanase